jgi:DNA-binding LacI/PurR family transcriptional regulator
MPVPPKHQEVRKALGDAVRAGEFARGSRLPSERELAARFGVSYMTARRAVADLVAVDLLERRGRSGTFVRAAAGVAEPDGPVAHRAASRVVHLVCPAGDDWLSRGFLRYGAQAVARQGWHSHVIRQHHGDGRAAVRALQRGELAIVLGGNGEHDALAEAMSEANGRAVVVANRMDERGVPSVLADDTHALRLAVSHLRDQGHHQIALLCNHPTHPVTRVQIGAWRSNCGDAAAPGALAARLLAVLVKPYDCLSTAAYERVRAFLASDASRGVTALISLVDEMALAALAAARDAGRPVPEELAVVSLGDSALLAYAHPAVTCVDVDLGRHLEHAVDLLARASDGVVDPHDRLRLIEPRLVVRQSVRPLP